MKWQRKKLLSGEGHKWYSVQNNVTTIKINEDKVSGHVARKIDWKCYQVLVTKPEENRKLGRLRCWFEANIKIEHTEIAREVWTGFFCLRMRSGSNIILGIYNKLSRRRKSVLIVAYIFCTLHQLLLTLKNKGG
jgi:hypothetical protein